MGNRIGEKIKLTSIDELLCVPETVGTVEIELGLISELRNEYIIRSNRESGLGRYDIMLEKKQEKDDAIIIEFKLYDKNKEADLEETANRALLQIEE